jgi:AbrB family looped-hinge helix DNA binding protein
MSTSAAAATARRLDGLGRMVLPAEMRKSLGLRGGDVLDLRVVGESLVITKRAPRGREP